MNPRSIRFRLIGLYAGLLVVAALLFGTFMHRRLERFLRNVLQTALEHRAEQIVRDILPEIPKRGEACVGTEIEKRFAPAINDRFVRVTGQDGRVLHISSAPADQSFVPEEVPPPSAGNPSGATEERAITGRSAMLVTVQHGTVAGQDYTVEVGTSLAASDRVLKALALTLAAGLPVLTGLAIFGGYVLMKRAMKPVQEIIASAQDITLHNLNHRLPVTDTGDEIEEMSKVLNQMIARLDESFQHVTRFTADASHELRTPLTVIHCELEALLRDATLSIELREALGSILEEVVHLVRIVEGLFALSKLDTGSARIERTRFDLAKLAETTAEQMCLLAEEKKIQLTCETRDPVMVEGEHPRLKQVIVNLLDNAIKYTPEGGNIVLTVREKNGHTLLEEADSGLGVPESALPHLFKRFYRADEAHSREVDGAGLGLSIVQSICAAHGGSVSIANIKPNGCLVTVLLPMTPSK